MADTQAPAPTTNSAPAAPIPRDAFISYLTTELDLPPSPIEPATRFVDDLGFDSLDMLELLIVIEELGVQLNDDLIEMLDTVDDAYRLYSRAASGSEQSQLP